MVEIELDGDATMTNWSKTMAARLHGKSDDLRIRNEKFVEERKLVREIGPQLWDEVLNQISIEGNALNAEMDRDVVTSKNPTGGQLNLTASLEDGARTCAVKYDYALGKISWGTDGGSTWNTQLSVGFDGKLAFHIGSTPYSPEAIATQILSSLLD